MSCQHCFDSLFLQPYCKQERSFSGSTYFNSSSPLFIISPVSRCASSDGGLGPAIQPRSLASGLQRLHPQRPNKRRASGPELPGNRSWAAGTVETRLKVPITKRRDVLSPLRPVSFFKLSGLSKMWQNHNAKSRTAAVHCRTLI